jgi:hypothetical protein
MTSQHKVSHTWMTRKSTITTIKTMKDLNERAQTGHNREQLNTVQKTDSPIHNMIGGRDKITIAMGLKRQIASTMTIMKCGNGHGKWERSNRYIERASLVKGRFLLFLSI